MTDPQDVLSNWPDSFTYRERWVWVHHSGETVILVGGGKLAWRLVGDNEPSKYPGSDYRLSFLQILVIIDGYERPVTLPHHGSSLNAVYVPNWVREVFSQEVPPYLVDDLWFRTQLQKGTIRLQGS